MPPRPLETLIAVFGAVAVVGVFVAGVLLLGSDDGGDDPSADREPPPPASEHAPEPAPEPEPFPPAVVTKIDASDRGAPHIGLGSAGAILVQPVEGGLSLLLAVHWNDRPPLLGPISSARQTDLELLGQFRQPVLAHSGAAPELLPLVAATLPRSFTPENRPEAFHRDTDQPGPRNLYVHPDRLPETPETRRPFPTGPAPRGGAPVTDYQVPFTRDSYEFTWSDERERWLVERSGEPFTSEETGQLDAGTVVVLRVPTETGLGITDASGRLSPFARTVGEGEATVLRDGRAFPATWQRSGAAEPTRLTTENGVPIALGPGRLWVLLAPE
ncbi:DUF3048 domain-containing protein [Haloechinothrix sp. LS1_15]|uniref:DUF3048 domain-containing protein n=1 Tax=Haloechinothrix sp. LS1_15 TaxID=2652248 RepID=UPI002945237C|nr:DUF3048 domain-containing protein [Haloechinothrix sp. LS1_15]MDV6013067.1 DUF3048 domain-containing protein [Haloechinothrix sp. LS1_15]